MTSENDSLKANTVSAKKPDITEWMRENNRMFVHIAGKCSTSTKEFGADEVDVHTHEEVLAQRDLCQEARLHALHALESFDYENFPIEKLGNYVYTVALNATREYVMDNQNNIRVPGSARKEKQKLNELSNKELIQLPKSINLPVYNDSDRHDSPGYMSLSGLIVDPAPTPDVVVDEKEQISILMEELESLRPEEQKVLKARWFNGSTLDDIALREGVSRQRVHSLQSKAMEKLRKKVLTRLSEEE
jgi:RNA polymerase sigma factor (sigma-70 family)